jgi:mevalonate kinase
MVTVSAPAKVHLMGEHAVVYGRPALVAAVNRRLTVSVSPIASGLHIETSETADYVRHIVALVTKDQGIKEVPGLKITISSAFPAGYHLGSSAAVAVATIGALLYFLKKTWNPIAINQLAYEAEKFAHGTPSGADNTVVTFGGLVWFRRELPFLKSIWQLPLKVPSSLHHFFLVDSGRPKETTKQMVAFVRAQFASARTRPRVAAFMSANEEQTRRIATALKEADEKNLILALQKGERTLEGMGVVSGKVLPFIRAVEASGGASKILGGGGRASGVGYLLCYHRNRDTLLRTAKKHGYSAQAVALGEEGIRLEKKS